MYDLDAVAHADVAGLDDAQISARLCDIREPLHPAGLAQPSLKGQAGHARAGHLEHYVAADTPPLADEGVVNVEAARAEVFAERARGERAAELELPPVEVLARIGVHGLVGAAVMFHVVRPIAGQANVAGPFRPGRTHRDGPRHRPLIDARRVQALPWIRLGIADIDGDQ